MLIAKRRKRENGAGLLFISCVINTLRFVLRAKELEMVVHFCQSYSQPVSTVV